MRHDALARTPVRAREFNKSMPPKTVRLQEPRAHTEPGAAVFMGAEQRRHRAAYPQLAQTHVPQKLSVLQTVSVLKHRMHVFGCNTWVGGPACLVGRAWEIPGGDTRGCPSMGDSWAHFGCAVTADMGTAVTRRRIGMPRSPVIRTLGETSSTFAN
jgi:hypothetical protein